ncbi:MAG: PQQ-binding-like beta-propeller repeat protein [Deltaproteobacteria bacterium]|nr:PQQ-binding-like beta-propeller repeat protein [Deltaproteobacteria bacterium]
MSRDTSALAVMFLVALALVWSAADDAFARPVRIGRYTEIPYGVPASPWVTGGGGPRRSGRSEHRAPVEAPTMVWETRLGSSAPSAPLLLPGGELYVGSSTGVTALGANGAVRWNQRLGFVTGTPSLSPSGDIVVGTNAGGLITLGRDGQVMHRTMVGGAVRTSPLVLDDGSVVVTALDQAVHRFDAGGRRLYRVTVAAQTHEPPAWTRDGLLLVPAGDSVHVLTARGERVASHSLGASIVAGPAVGRDGTVWALTHDGALHQFRGRGGPRQRTPLDITVSNVAGIAVGQDGAVRVPGRNDALVCVGPTGTERWRVTGEGGFTGEVTVDAADVTLAISTAGRLLAVDPAGEIKWRVDVGARTLSAVVLGEDGTLYVATARGTIQAWR